MCDLETFGSELLIPIRMTGLINKRKLITKTLSTVSIRQKAQDLAKGQVNFDLLRLRKERPETQQTQKNSPK